MTTTAKRAQKLYEAYRAKALHFAHSGDTNRALLCAAHADCAAEVATGDFFTTLQEVAETLGIPLSDDETLEIYYAASSQPTLYWQRVLHPQGLA